MTSSIILVPLDGSEAALRALAVAKGLAEIEQAHIQFVHVTGSELVGADLLTRLKLPSIHRHAIQHRLGEPAEQILRFSEEIKPRLIVMCRFTAGNAGKTLGGTAMKVLRNAPCPVVLVSPKDGPVSWRLHHVLVPHDGTPTTSAALRPAVELAGRSGAELLVVHVAGAGAAPSEPGSMTTSRYLDQSHHEWPAWTEEFMKRFASMCPLNRLHVRLLLARGDPAAETVRLAKAQSMDLVVLAWRGKWEGERAATLKKILREAHCPIMVVRA
jgi:nucleotide-binding universal stress UspA family protein